MSAGVTAGAGLLSGVAQYEAGRTRSNLLRSNASVAGQQSQSELDAESRNEQALRMKQAAVTGQQVAQTGANNLQQRGSPSQVQQSTAEINETDILTMRNNAMRKAWGFQVQRASDTFQSEQAGRIGAFQGAGSILAGGGKSLEQYNATGEFL
jgi:hypothetical protein